MENLIDNAIIAYTKDRSDEKFTAMYASIMIENLYIPVTESVKERV